MSYTHVQAISNTVWEVNHNLNKKVICDVYIYENVTLVKVIPSYVKYVNDNKIEVGFTIAQSGKVKVV